MCFKNNSVELNEEIEKLKLEKKQLETKIFSLEKKEKESQLLRKKKDLEFTSNLGSRDEEIVALKKRTRQNTTEFGRKMGEMEESLRTERNSALVNQTKLEKLEIELKAMGNLEAEAKKKDEEMETLRTSLEEITSKNTDNEAKLEQVRSDCEANKGEIEKMLDQEKEYTTIIEGLGKEKADLLVVKEKGEETITNLKKELSDSENKLKGMIEKQENNREVITLRKQVSEHNTTIEGLKNEIADLKSSLEKGEKEKGEISTKSRQYKVMIGTIQKVLKLKLGDIVKRDKEIKAKTVSIEKLKFLNEKNLSQFKAIVSGFVKHYEKKMDDLKQVIEVDATQHKKKMVKIGKRVKHLKDHYAHKSIVNNFLHMFDSKKKMGILKKRITMITASEIRVLSAYTKPPRAIHVIVRSVLLILKKTKASALGEWEVCRKFLKPEVVTELKKINPQDYIHEDKLVGMIDKDLKSLKGAVLKKTSESGYVLLQFMLTLVARIRKEKKDTEDLARGNFSFLKGKVNLIMSNKRKGKNGSGSISPKSMSSLQSRGPRSMSALTSRSGFSPKKRKNRL